MDNRIGAQYYTIRDSVKTLEDFDASCKRVSEMGYKVIQLSAIGDFAAEDIKKVIDKYGLTVACTHHAPAKYLEDIDAEIAFHKTIGCKVCGIGCFPNPTNATMESVTKFVEDFRPVIKKLAENDLIFGYHNHALEFIKLDGKYIFDIIFEGFKDLDNFKLILDVYWLAYAGKNPSKFIKDYSDKIACIHYKDMKMKTGREQIMAEVGQGTLDWDDIIAASFESDALFALVEQDICETDPFGCLKTSYDFLTSKGFI